MRVWCCLGDRNIINFHSTISLYLVISGTHVEKKQGQDQYTEEKAEEINGKG